MRSRLLPIAAAVLLAALSASTTKAAAARHDPDRLVRAFACIHHFEGGWTANTGNGYFGGLQMDWSFMRAYGREFLEAFGTADRWPPSLQVAVAVRAYLSGRGFWPWPNTARLCGLI